MPHATCARVILAESLTKTISLLRLDCPEIAACAAPGQFVFVHSLRDRDPLLPRAFSIADSFGGTAIDLLIRRVGKGTALLQSLPKGARLSIVGPLGNGFATDIDEPGACIFVAGGVGIAPFPLLAKKLCGEKILLYGARTGDEIVFRNRFDQRGVKTRFATEDGSLGEKGFVTQLLERLVETPARVYACGPDAMLKEVCRVARERGLPCEVSLETKMACGIGVCYGCITSVARAGQIRYERVCRDGPVFNAQDVFTDAPGRASA